MFRSDLLLLVHGSKGTPSSAGAGSYDRGSSVTERWTERVERRRLNHPRRVDAREREAREGDG